MFARVLFLFLGIIFLSSSCQKKSVTYAFFVAGHTYGSPSDTLPGLHPPFVNDFIFLRNIPHIEFGIFTGDMVYHSKEDYWQKVDQQIKLLKLPVFFAVGNHDEGQKPVYQHRYGRTYYSFHFENDLFIVLDPGLNGWNILNDQLAFLKEELLNVKLYNHIFIFMHQVLWWEGNGKYTDLKINSIDGRAPTINFLSELEPMLRTLDKPIYLFAGDVGATPDKTSFFYDHYDNIYLVASGMGNLIQDNYLIVEVMENKVAIKIRWIGQQELQKIDELL